MLRPAALVLLVSLAAPAAASAQWSCDPGTYAYRLRNYAPEQLHWRARGETTWRSLGRASTDRFCFPRDEIEIEVRGRSGHWRVEPGAHHFWWDDDDDRIELDMNSAFYLGSVRERVYEVVNLLDGTARFLLNGTRRSIPEGKVSTFTITSAWAPQLRILSTGRMYRLRRCNSIFWSSRNNRIGVDTTSERC